MPEASVTAHLAASDVATLRKPVNGQGGMQTLLRNLQERVGDDGTLLLTRAEVEKIRRYAKEYGEGGFQNRFRMILASLPSEGPRLDDFS